MLATYQRSDIIVDGFPERAESNRDKGMWDYKTPEWVPLPLAFKPNRTKEMLAEIYRGALTANRTDPAILERKVHDSVPSNSWSRRAHLLSGNGLGFDLVDSYKGGLIAAIVNRYRITTASLDLLRLRVALERYHLDRGDWPGDLDLLVPAYLDAVPGDLFDGKPLRYDMARKVIYSIGRDSIDNGGISADDPVLPSPDVDIVLELEPTEPAPWPEFPAESSPVR